MNLPILSSWFYAIPVVIGIALVVAYVILVRQTKKEKCKQCGTKNPIEATQCEQCGESLMMPRPDAKGVLGAVGSLLGIAPFVLLALNVQDYSDPPIPELIIVGIGFLLFIIGIVIVASLKNLRIRIKQRATIAHASFFGGYCAKCGTEMLGGMEKCLKCGWKVNAEKPNWAIASKNGKAGLPVVDLKITCYKCKTENAIAVLKCKECGANLLSYKPVWLRVSYFVASVLFSLGTGWIVMRAFEDPDVFEGLDAIGFGVISLTLITIVMPFYGLYLALSGGKLPELLAERAERHLKGNPWQALEDYGHALELATVQEHARIMSNRMKVYRSLGLAQNATREELAITYARERNPQGGFGLFMAGNIFGDSFSQGYLGGISKQARKDREKMFSEGRAIILGYCPVCKEALELNNEFKCPNSEKAGAPKHSGKPKFLQYVIPADAEAGKAAVLRAMEAGNRALRNRMVTIVLLVFGAAALCSLFNYLTSL
jgi:ribosomal protein L40E